MHEETSRASLSMMIPRDQTVSSWYTCPLLKTEPYIVYRRQDTDIVGFWWLASRESFWPRPPRHSAGLRHRRFRCASRCSGYVRAAVCGNPRGAVHEVKTLAAARRGGAADPVAASAAMPHDGVISSR